MESTLRLTPVQRDILTALVNFHRQEGRTIKGKGIAELLGRHPGTIRNNMHTLRDLNLVESLIGPKGGYKATAAAYDVLSMDNNGDGDEVIVPVVRNGFVVEGVSATEIIFNKIMDSTHKFNGLIRIIGSISTFDIGDDVEIGPTPVNKLYIYGTVVGLDYTTSGLVLNVTGIVSIPGLPVKTVARRAVRISPSTSLKEASRLMVINGVQEALVEDGSLGLIDQLHMTRAVAEGRTDLEVQEVMTHNLLTINSEEPIFEAIKILGMTGERQLVVLDNGVPWGVITPRNLIDALTPA